MSDFQPDRSWHQEADGLWYPPDTGQYLASDGNWYSHKLPPPPEAEWFGPVAWGLFLLGLLAAFVGAQMASSNNGAGGVVVFAGIVACLIGLGMLAKSGRIIPSRR